MTPAAPFVIPIAEADALAWVSGSISDLDVLLRARLAPQAVFVGDLPCLAAWKLTVRLCRHWQRAGAIGAVYRTSNQVLVKHFERFGAREICQDQDGRRRYLLPKEGFDRWLGKS
jgi:hypothetical protein